MPLANHPYSIIVTGVGGTGIVTIGAMLGMAAHLEGKGVGIIDMAGLAQKGGAVYSHIRIANSADDIHAIRVAAGGADLVLGGDIVVVGNKKVLTAIKPGNTRVVVNTAEFLPGDFTRNADFSLPTERLKRAITGAAGARQQPFRRCRAARRPRCSAIRSAPTCSCSATPISSARCRCRREAIEKAIEMNGEAVAMNIAAFRYGRRAAVDPAAVRGAGRAARRSSRTTRCKLSQIFDEMVARRVGFPHRLSEPPLCARAIARWSSKVADGRSREGAGHERLRRGGRALSVQADGLQGRVRGRAALQPTRRFVEQREGAVRRRHLRFEFHLAPPMLAQARPGDRRAEEDVVRSVDAARVRRAVRNSNSCAARRSIRSAIAHERRTERQLIADYEALLAKIARRADARPITPPRSRLPSIPEKIRGFGPVKQRHLAAAKAEEAALARAVPGRRTRRFSRRPNKPDGRFRRTPRRARSPLRPLMPPRLTRLRRCFHIETTKTARKEAARGNSRTRAQGRGQWEDKAVAHAAAASGGYVSEAVDPQRPNFRHAAGYAAQGPRHLANLDLGADARDRARLSVGLHRLGVKRGDTIAIVGANRPRLYWSVMAAQMLGAMPVPVYADAVADEMAFVLAHAEVALRRGRGPGAGRQDPVGADRCRSSSASIYDEPRGLRDYDHGS